MDTSTKKALQKMHGVLLMVLRQARIAAMEKPKRNNVF